jgi:hypothetical protein
MRTEQALMDKLIDNAKHQIKARTDGNAVGIIYTMGIEHALKWCKGKDFSDAEVKAFSEKIADLLDSQVAQISKLHVEEIMPELEAKLREKILKETNTMVDN